MESKLMREIWVGLSSLGVRLFRNNVADGWIGDSQYIKQHKVIGVEPGDVVIRQARKIKSGLCVGSSDLIGWRSVLVTKDMVGQTVAIFLAVEVKQPKGRISTEQTDFIAAVKSAGGISFVARSLDEAMSEFKT